jgi:hypothetical protein
MLTYDSMTAVQRDADEQCGFGQRARNRLRACKLSPTLQHG